MNRSKLFAGALAVMANQGLAKQATGEVVLLDAQVKEREIEFQVSSGGCTSKSHFGLETLKMNPLTVRLVRIRPDYCEADVPQGAKVIFTYAELGAKTALAENERKRIIILNDKQAP